ncbi:MAG TPA: carboxypeptidase-like regulatory domain-containing protein [Bacteroidales bacterium]|nr:carboxypeptidase-like regulatory domain-containing protein [Bacteroidales bacterium]
MNRYSRIQAIILFHLFSICISAQNALQTIKGTVRDAYSQVTLPGATVTIMDTEPVIGITTDINGEFRIKDIKPGRYNLKISYLGYEPLIINEVLVQSGKEVILTVELLETATALQEVEIKASSNKENAINPMAMVSSRQLNMEEASRYAGGIDDPSRLASSFAGVAGSLSSNAIVIRGNAPKGLLWRMEGIEIPNPSHFANVSTFGGGGITALSSHMLGNSDFYTGAFPSEFGNALSGVFDMRIRTGNNEKREHTIKAGIIGLDFATEGPFIKGKKSSYLLNYRYSTLALISPLLPENAQGLRYQDLSFKFNFPAGKAGAITAWGLFSSDHTGSAIKEDSADWEFYQDIESDENINGMGAAGINHKVILSDKTYINTALAGTGNVIKWQRDRLRDDGQLFRVDDIFQSDTKYTLSFLVNHKFSAAHINRTGFNVSLQNYNITLLHKSTEAGDYETVARDKGSSGMVQFYTQSRLNLTNELSLNTGLHSRYFLLNKEWTIEPRASIKWKFREAQSVTLAYGLHSRSEPLGFYLAGRDYLSERVQPNRYMKLAKAHHIVFSYERSLGQYTRLRIEPYIQQLFDVPVIANSSFSLLNLEMDWFFNDSLVNTGTGRNTGIDITFEKFLSNGTYYLITGSLFDARYKGGDGVIRNSRFNKNYVFNFLFGNEWSLPGKNDNLLGLNCKFTLLGGDRISPVDNEASSKLKDVVYDEQHAFSERKPAVYYLDFSASWKKNRQKYSSTWSVQFINLLFQKEFYGHRYNFRTGNVEPLREIVVIPNLSYRIDF